MKPTQNQNIISQKTQRTGGGPESTNSSFIQTTTKEKAKDPTIFHPTITIQVIPLNGREIQTTEQQKSKIFKDFYDSCFPVLEDFDYIVEGEDEDVEQEHQPITSYQADSERINAEEEQRRAKEFFEGFGISPQDCRLLILLGWKSLDPSIITNFLSLDNIVIIKATMTKCMRGNFSFTSSQFFNLLNSLLKSSQDQEISKDFNSCFLFETRLHELAKMKTDLQNECKKVFQIEIQSPSVKSGRNQQKRQESIAKAAKAWDEKFNEHAKKLKEFVDFIIANVGKKTSNFMHSTIMLTVEKILTLQDTGLDDSQIQLLKNLKLYLCNVANIYCQTNETNDFDILILGLKLQKIISLEIYQKTLPEKFSPNNPDMIYGIFDQFDIELLEDCINLGYLTFAQIGGVTLNCNPVCGCGLKENESEKKDEALSKSLFKFLSKNESQLINFKYFRLIGAHHGDMDIPLLNSLQWIYRDQAKGFIFGKLTIPTLPQLTDLALDTVGQLIIASQPKLNNIYIVTLLEQESTIQLPQPKDQTIKIKQGLDKLIKIEDKS